MAVESCGDICALPEDCIANALSFTSPKDACRLSAVASTFRSASQLDTVWDRFLPSDFRDLISGAVDGPESLLSRFHSKKELYLHLCEHPILIDGGRKSLSLEKHSGKICYMIAAGALSIVWMDTPQYWRWVSLPESRFPKVAELLNVCWFEIRGKISTKMLSPGTCYAAYLVFIRKPGAYGFDDNPVEAFVELRGHASERSSVFLDQDGAHRQRRPIVPRSLGLYYHRLRRLVSQQTEDASGEADPRFPKPRSDGWMEVKLGEYIVKGREDGDLELGVMEVNHGNWKSGLIVEGIELRPKAMTT